MRDEVYVYVICRDEAGEPVKPTKVGISRSPGARLLEIQTASPFKVRLHAQFPMPDRAFALTIERMFHEVLAPSNLYGEWFDLSPDLARFMIMMGVDVFLSEAVGLEEEEKRTVYQRMMGPALAEEATDE